MKTFRQISEASVHPMAVHAYPSGKNQFTVHAIGSKVSHVSVGDKLTSSDLDDLSDAGHKVKEVKKPMNEAKMAGWKCDCGCMNSPTSMECKECETPRPVNEDIEQIDELDDKPHGTLNAYRNAMDAVKTDISSGRYPQNKIKNRQAGAAMLARRNHNSGSLLSRNTKVNSIHTGMTNRNEEVEHVEEGLGKTLAAGALALGLGAGASASMGNDKPVHYQVQKIGSDYNVYHKNNVGGKVHFSSKNKDDAMKWAMQKEEVEQGNYFDEAADLTKIDTKTLETLTQLHKHYGQKNPAAAASAKRGEEELKRRMKKEEVEQIDEISKKTAFRAVGDAASGDHPKTADLVDRISKKWGSKAGEHAADHAHASYFGRTDAGRTPRERMKRDALSDAKPSSKMRTTKSGVINKQDVESKKKEIKSRLANEEVEQVDEISSATLVSYSQKAHNQVKGNQPADPDKLRKRTNREQGIKLAFNKHYQVRTKVPATIKEEEIDEADHVDEGKANWDKAHKQGLIDTLHNRMLQKKSMPRMGVLSKAASRELAAKAVAAGKGGKIEEAESGLSTKTLANYSNKASDASKHRTMPTGKVDNRHAGVSKVDKILAIRDKKKFD